MNYRQTKKYGRIDYVENVDEQIDIEKDEYITQTDQEYRQTDGNKQI